MPGSKRFGGGGITGIMTSQAAFRVVG